MREKRQGPPRPHLKPRKVKVIPPQEDNRERFEKFASMAILNWESPTIKKIVMEADQSAKESPDLEEEYAHADQPSTSTVSIKQDHIDDIINFVANGKKLTKEKKVLSKNPRPTVVAQCQECGLILKHPSRIKIHMRSHTGEKPFQCHICHQRFITISTLRVHQKRHYGERDVACSWDCGKKFVSISCRNEHERIVHAGIKRYQCTYEDCDRFFTRRYNLLTHRKTVHGEDADVAELSVVGSRRNRNIRIPSVEDVEIDEYGEEQNEEYRQIHFTSGPEEIMVNLTGHVFQELEKGENPESEDDDVAPRLRRAIF